MLEEYYSFLLKREALGVVLQLMLSCSQHACISSRSHSCSLLQETGQKENFQLGNPIKQSAEKMAKWPPALTMMHLLWG